MNKFTILLSMLFITALSYGQIVIFEEDFDADTQPENWWNSAAFGDGVQIWTFGTGDMPTGTNFTTNAAIFNDDAAGDTGFNDVATLKYPSIASGIEIDISSYLDTSAVTLSYEYALQVAESDGSQYLYIDIWDQGAAAYVHMKTYDTDTNPTFDTIDINAIVNANPGINTSKIQIAFIYDDIDGGWGWGAGIDNVRLIATPTNDNICNAIPLTVGVIPAGDAYTTVDATVETGEPAGSCWYDGDGVDNSVWFSFEATATDMTISTNFEGGTMTDTQFSVYTDPTDCTDASTLGAEIGCDEDSGIGLLSYLELTGLTVEDTYYIQVDGWNGEEGTFGISVVVTPPANNECATATELLVGDSFDENAIESTLLGATNTYSGGGTGPEVFFTVEVPASGALTIESNQATGSPMDDTFMLVKSGSCDDFVSVSTDDNSGDGNFAMITLTGQTPGETLYVILEKDFGYSGALGSFMISAYDHTVGIADATIAGFSMYPNPVQNVLNLTAQNSIDTVSIYNLLGQEVLNATPSTTQAQVDMSNLPTGAYVVKVQAGEQVGSYNLIKE